MTSDSRDQQSSSTSARDADTDSVSVVSTDVQATAQKDKSKRTPAQKKMDRILANRISARRSRDRKKHHQDNLEATVTLLSKQNDDLFKENNQLKQQLLSLIEIISRGEQPVVPSSSNDLGYKLLQLQLAAASRNSTMSPTSSIPTKSMISQIDGRSILRPEQLILLSQLSYM
mmetsp:Transcript_2437/g.3242  ORF Transcript_2437/g.3242 Transcript_2437/m.3242 type:complete len:173 (+) Transcript_2437:69-587(+)